MILTRAPLRIPLGGGGTDFPSYYLKYGGYILGFALNKYVRVVLHDTIDNYIYLKYSKTEKVKNVDQLENRVAAEALKWYGITKGIEVATFSDVPESSGLGGSSSFCVALVTALRQKLGLPQNKKEIFASAYDIERNKAKQPGGIQDQFFATFGGAWSLELGERFTRKPVNVLPLLPKLKLVYTNTSRTNLGIASTQVEKATLDDKSLISNLNSIKEQGKNVNCLLTSGNLDSVGLQFHEHWELKKSRDSRITNPEVDRLYNLARQSGALGGKLLGLGGGGYLLLYTNSDLDGIKTIPVGLDSTGCKVVYQDNTRRLE